jgi:23S rRNA (guanosine2251-2'-O)-methyltransferase
MSRVLLARSAGVRGSLREIIAEARARRVVVHIVDRRRLDVLARGAPHQGVAGIAAAAPMVEVDDLVRLARERGEPPFLIALDGVEDPHNLGAVIRTAEAAGAHGVIIPRRRAAGLGPGAGRASAGAIAHLAVATVGNLVAALDRLKAQGIWVVGADPTASERYDRIRLAAPVALVLGGEGSGLHRLVRERCDRLVRIPLRGRVASLNVSVAAALLLYEVARHASACDEADRGAPLLT